MRTAERPKNTTGIISVSARGTLNPSETVSFVILFFLLMACTRLFFSHSRYEIAHRRKNVHRPYESNDSHGLCFFFT